MIQIVLFFALSFALYFVSRKTINSCFYFFSRFFKSPQSAYRMMALLYFPGTALHEISHYLIALLLGFKNVNINLIPKIRGNTITLGTVTYNKRDPVRGLIIGIAPFFAALFFFKVIDASGILFLNVWWTAIVSFFIFTVSSTMFSSKQDLVDAFFVSAIFLLLSILTFIAYRLGFIVGIKELGVIIQIVINAFTSKELIAFVQLLNQFLIFSLILNGGMIMVLQLILRIKK